jgi:hypothetical protein
MANPLLIVMGWDITADLVTNDEKLLEFPNQPGVATQTSKLKLGSHMTCEDVSCPLTATASQIPQ